jgi:hypothetical protein
MKFLLRLVFFFLLGWGNLYAQSNLPPCPSSGHFHNCFGTFTFASGNKYVGEFKDGKYNGQGTYTYLRGDKYVGEFKDGKSNGQGTETLANGDKYVGEFKDGKYNGQGTYTYLNGDKYVGEFKDGKSNGQGTETLANGSINYQGIWADGNFVRSASLQQATATNTEIERLRAEADEAKRKQVEAEAQLKLAQQTIQTSLTLASVKGFGLSVTNITDAQKSQLKIKGGVRVESLIEPAIRAGLREGDVILAVANIEVSQVKDFGAALSKLDKSKPVNVLFRRGELTRFALIRPDQSGDADLERNLAEQKAKEQQRLAEDARIKEQQRLALEASEISRLRAEAEESKRKQAELEQQLRQAQQVTSIPTQTASTGAVGRRIALVVGNGNYKIRPLKNSKNDADDVSGSLKATGFEVIDLRDASLPQMRTAVRQFGDRLVNNDVGLVYYSGHGVEVKGRNYFIPVNADIQREDEIADQGLDVSLILEKMSTAGKGVNILIVDACRDDPFGRSFRSSSRGLAQMDAPRGTIIAYATSPGKVASDGDPRERNSPYTKHLVKAMQSPNKPIEQVFKEVRRAVQDETKDQQTPWENTSLSGDFFFRVLK